LAGHPTTIVYSGTSFVTTLFAPTTAHLCIWTLEQIVTLSPIQTKSSIIMEPFEIKCRSSGGISICS